MGFVSILSREPQEYMESGVPTFMYDLNLDQVIEQIQATSTVPVKKFFYQMPTEKADEDYRRAVYVDVKCESVYKLLVEFMNSIEARNGAKEQKTQVNVDMQRYVWHVLEVVAYCKSYVKLYEGLCQNPITSEGLLALRELLSEYVNTESFSNMYKKAVKLQERLQTFHIKLILEKDQITVSEEQVEGTYEKYLKKHLGQEDKQMSSPFSKSAGLCEFEQEIVRKLEWQKLDFFDEVSDFYEQYEKYEHDILLQFAEEIAYYLAYNKFQQQMELKGCAFVTPTVDEKKDMSACGLYDLALACVNLPAGKNVVSNDMVYGKGETFLIVTGPNQGGKTTFARSLGQLIYLCKMGLDVPATVANIHYFSEILTHFSVEESVETGRGKLMEELIRLKPMMSAKGENAFVIINELFTTAANYDACLMGKKVLEHFINQGCRGIYVTHLKELTEAHESVVSMRAMLDEQKQQSFQILRREAVESACAINQVHKHGLTYEMLKERLS